MRSEATTVDEYLSDLPEARRGAISAVRTVVLEHLPDGYVEVMNWGMISYEVPLEVSGKTYNGKPLMYAALASQKNHMAIYLCGLYCLPGTKEAFEEAYSRAGMKLDMGAACVRFKKLEDLHLGAVADAIGATPMGDFVAASARDGKRKKK